jgi:hypothetical protein
MKPIHRLVAATALASGLVCVAAAATVHGQNQAAQVNAQLALARAATAKYHDVNEAIGDGYVPIGTNPTEDDAFELVNFNLLDCTLDAAQPEALRYVESGGRLRLIAVEYAIPMACSPNPPESFLPGAGEWEQEAGVPFWMMGVFVWSGDSAGTN